MSIYTEHKPEGGDGLFLKLKDGDSFKLRAMSEPVITLYKETDKPRYANIFYNHDTKKVQIFGYGISIYSQIAALVEDWGEPTDFDIRIKREGSGATDTSYLVTPVKQSTEPPQEALLEAEKIDLPEKTKGKWLTEYAEDHILPDPAVLSLPDPTPTDDDAPGY
jgi:hypothetical protein